MNAKKMNIVLFSFTIFLFSLFISCSNFLIPPDDKLSMAIQSYDGKELRIDGYYYYLSYTKEMDYYDVYFFYSNGVILYIGTLSESKIINIDEYISRTEHNYKTGKTGLGVYIIQDSIIKFEKWYPASPHEAIPTYVREGKILNDTTFHITKSYRGNGTELSEENEIYHFRKFSPKPDSTNVFIK